MFCLGIKDMADYETYLAKNPKEYTALLHSLTIKVSEFFRDPEIFNYLEQAVLPAIFKAHAQKNDYNIRIWSTACAYGEEVYSTAILILEYLQRMDDAERSRWHITILGTDIDPLAVEKAVDGVYSIKSVKDILPLHPNAFERIKGMPNHLQIAPEVRGMAQFVCFDIATAKRLSPPAGIFAEYDLIYCRNVLIYYDCQQKLDTLYRLYTCLCPYGYLVLGKAEGIPDELSACFIQVKPGIKIYRKENVHG